MNAIIAMPRIAGSGRPRSICSAPPRGSAARRTALNRLYPAPLRDEQCGGSGRFAQRLQIDIFVEAMHRSPTGAEAQARDVVVQPVEARVGQRREDEILHRATINRGKGLAE